LPSSELRPVFRYVWIEDHVAEALLRCSCRRRNSLILGVSDVWQEQFERL